MSISDKLGLTEEDMEDMEEMELNCKILNEGLPNSKDIEEIARRHDETRHLMARKRFIQEFTRNMLTLADSKLGPVSENSEIVLLIDSFVCRDLEPLRQVYVDQMRKDWDRQVAEAKKKKRPWWKFWKKKTERSAPQTPPRYYNINDDNVDMLPKEMAACIRCVLDKGYEVRVGKNAFLASPAHMTVTW